MKRHAILVLGLVLGYATLACAASPAPGTKFRDCLGCPEMIVVPAGSFMMGMDEGARKARQEKWREGQPASANPKFAEYQAKEAAHAAPVHRVTIRHSFAIGVYHVTRGEFAAFVKATGYRGAPDERGEASCYVFNGEHFWPDKVRPGSWDDPGFPQTDRDPVACMDFDDAHAYVAWLTKQTGKPYRLLSEAEFEYAARGGTSTLYHWGDDPALACQYGNWADHTALRMFKIPKSPADCDDHHVFTSPVGSFKPNPFGLYDMGGNLGQLLEDCDRPNYIGAPSTEQIWAAPEKCEKHMTRGSSWKNPSSSGESGFREPIPNVRSSEFGFRVARSLE